MRSGAACLTAVAIALAACQQTNTVRHQTAALTLSADSLAQRQMQLRRFDTADERIILAAAAGVMQDLGFSIEESSAATGLIVGSKERDAVEAGQVAGQMFLAVLIAAMGGRADPTWDATQRIRVSVATKPSGDRSAIVARVTFQRILWNTKNQLSRVETIDAPEIYRQFFDKLSQSAFLEAHQI